MCAVMMVASATQIVVLMSLLAILPYAHSGEDYWIDHFDEGTNCRQEKKINQLVAKGVQCEAIQAESDTQTAFQVCKSRLEKKLHSLCTNTMVSSPGEFIYCKKRNLTKCCISNYTCVDSWSGINSQSFDTPANLFLSDPAKSLQVLEKQGYKKCHRINGYDASACAEDCNQLKNGDFAKNCTAKGGFFKCCIRRDMRKCHQCRFCCSLPMCAEKASYGVHHSADDAMDDQATQTSAIEKFRALKPMYKSSDYRCLKADQAKKPEEWPHYVHKDFTAATSEEELEKAATIPFDVNFMNFEDPDVFQRLTGPDYQKYWKETFGYDWVNQEKTIAYANNTYDIELTEMMKHCLASEFSEFAEKCRAESGFYKCCGSALSLNVFELLRVHLSDQGLLEKPNQIICGNVSTDTKCSIATATHMCTKKEILTGKYVTIFETPTQPKYEVGGNPSDDPAWSGFRSYKCLFLNSCQTHDAMPYIDDETYKTISNKATYCEAGGKAKDITNNKETPKKIWEYVMSECPKRKFATAFMCRNDSFVESEQAKQALKSIRQGLKKLSVALKSGSGKSQYNEKLQENRR